MIYIVSYYPPDKGGAEMFLSEIQNWLEDAKWVNSVDKVDHDAELIITSGVNQTFTAQQASSRGVPCVVLIQHWKEVYDPSRRVVDDHFFELIKSDAILVCCSMFLRKEIQDVCSVRIPRILYPVGKCVDNHNWKGGDYLFVPNISKDKGGSIFNDLMEYGIPLVGISHSNSKLELLIKKRAKRLNHVLVIDATDQSNVYRLMEHSKAVICIHDVEETFCRTAWEAMCIGAPVIAKKNGNFPYLLGEGGNYASKASQVARLLDNLNVVKRSSMFCPFQSREILLGLISDAKNNVQKDMYMGPWSDQGLGRQMKRYITESTSVVFSWKCSINRDIVFQGSSRDWVHPYVYWSENYRHNVTKKEIERVVREFNVGNLYVLEPSGKIFEELRGLSCMVIAIPNIETVRKSEVVKYNHFNQIICHTKQCYQYFRSFSSAIYHPIPFDNFDHIGELSYPVKYLLLGGTKPFGRKQSERVMEVFEKFDKGCSLTITMQANKTFSSPCTHIRIIQKNMSSEEVDWFYNNHDVVIVLSCQEGLGLSLIEALERGKPVIATNMAPHNEYVQNERNGWLVDGKDIPLMDNSESLFNGLQFDSRKLEDTITMINNRAKNKT